MNVQKNIPKYLLILSLASVPTCYVYANYNVPLLFFTYLFWELQIQKIRGRLLYLVIWSWIVDLIWILLWVPKWHSESFAQFKTSLYTIVSIISIAVFIFKLVILILLMVYDKQCQENLKLSTMWNNAKDFMSMKQLS